MLNKSKFALQNDESTVTDNKEILLGYVRFINEHNEITEEMLFADTTGSSTFKIVTDYLRKNSSSKERGRLRTRRDSCHVRSLC